MEIRSMESRLSARRAGVIYEVVLDSDRRLGERRERVISLRRMPALFAVVNVVVVVVAARQNELYHPIVTSSQLTEGK